MSIYSFIVNNLYRKQTTCSVSQLKDDFLEYPPKPLNCTQAHTPFNIVAIGKLGGAIFPLMLVVKVVSTDKSNISFRESELKEIDFLKGLASDCSYKWTAGIKELKSNYASHKFASTCAVILFFPVFLLALPFVLARPISKLIVTVFSAYKVHNKRLGFYLPILKDDHEIFVNEKLILKRGVSMPSIISHEHIHLLQHIDATCYEAASTEKVRIRDPQILLDSAFCNDRSLLYILEKNEMEARLHEFVLSYYRKFGHIPLTFDGFMLLITSCSDLGGSVLDYLMECGGSNYFKKEHGYYSVREERIVDDVYFAVSSIKNSDLKYKFVTEVLAIMYGNLIGYYGDRGASHNFLKQIKGPNLYDRLYNYSNS